MPTRRTVGVVSAAPHPDHSAATTVPPSQRELLQPLAHRVPKASGVTLMLESDDDIVSISHGRHRNPFTLPRGVDGRSLLEAVGDCNRSGEHLEIEINEKLGPAVHTLNTEQRQALGIVSVRRRWVLILMPASNQRAI
jgi:hypothetical protein